MKRLLALAALAVCLTVLGTTSQASAGDHYYSGHGGHHGSFHSGHGYCHGGYGHGSVQSYAPSYGSHYGSVPSYGYPSAGYGSTYQSGYRGSYAPGYGQGYGQGYGHGGGVHLDIGRVHVFGHGHH